MIIILEDLHFDGQENADDNLIKNLVKAASAIVEKKINDPVFWPFFKESYLIATTKQVSPCNRVSEQNKQSI